MSAEPEIIVAVEGKITDAELDEIEACWKNTMELPLGAVDRLIKALRACRKQSKAKDAVIEQALYSRAPDYAEVEHPGWCGRARAALDKGTDDAGS